MKPIKFAAFVLVAVASQSALATNGAQHFTPVVNESGIITLHGSSYGESSIFGLGLNYNLAIDPMEVRHPAANGQSSRSALDNYLHSLNIGVGSKVHDRIHLFADASVHYLTPTGDSLDTRLTARDDAEFVIGNIKLGAGFAILDNSNGGVGVGVIPHFVVPLSDKHFYLSEFTDSSNPAAPAYDLPDDAFQYGATLAVDYRAVHKDHLVLNIGWDKRARLDYITYGVGYQTPFMGTGRHNLLFELRGETNIDDPKIQGRDPLEADIAYKGYSENRNCSYTAGLGRGFNNDIGSPDLRVFLGLNWQLDHGHDHAEHHEEPAVAKAEPVAEAPKAPEPTPPPPPAPVEEKVVAGVSTLKVNKIYFANNSDAILAKSNAALDKLAADMQANPGLKKVQIEGYTDNVGNAEYNKTLSQKRADSVKKYLTDKGVDGNRLTTEGMGPENPLASNDTPAGRATNRRVEFRIQEVDGNIKMELAD